MNKFIWTPVIFSLLLGMMFTSCDSPSQKVRSAEANVEEAEEDLAQAKEEYRNDVETYRLQTAERIAANKRSINEFKVSIERETPNVRTDYNKKIAELEKKNSDLQMKLDSYEADSKGQWEAFKIEFNRDMEHLGTALKDLTRKNN